MPIKKQSGAEPVSLKKDTCSGNIEDMVANSPDMISRHAPDGTFIYVSPVCRSLLGYEAEELVGRNLYDAFHPDDLPAVKAFHSSVIKYPGIRMTVSYRMRRKDGNYIRIETAGKGVSDPETGRLREIIWVTRDISEFRQGYQMISEGFVQPGRLNFLLNTAPAGIYTRKAQGDFRITFMSANVKSLLGYEAEEFIQDPAFWSDRIHDQDKAACMESLQTLSESRGVREYEYRFLHKNGTYCWMRDRRVLICDESGLPVEIIGSWSDDTERHDAAEALQKSEKMYRLLAENTEDVIWTRDSDMRFTYISPSLERLTGYRPEEMDAGLPENLLSSFSLENIMNITSQNQESENAASESLRFDQKIKRKNGSAIWVDTILTCLYSEKNELTGLLGVARNIDQRKRAEEKLKNYAEALETAKKQAETANLAKSEFFANMSHEIRTPLNAILGFSEILLNKVENPQYRYYLNAVLSSGKSLLGLFNDILDLSKIEAGRLEICLAPVNLTEMLRDTELIFSQKASEKGLTFRQDTAGLRRSSFLLDEAKLREILEKLIGNAVKFTLQGEVKVTVRGEYEDPKPDAPSCMTLFFEVSDTGIGIPHNRQEIIFESFRQEDSSVTRKYEGSGLGLAITKKLVEIMHGSISVESEPGKGSTFRVVFPRVETVSDPNAVRKTDSSDTEVLVFENARILLVDDVQYNRALVSGYLEDSGLSVLEAENGDEALNILENCRSGNLPDLILTDLKMPEKNGYTLRELIKEKEELAGIPVIALTGSQTRAALDKITVLFDGCLQKPLTRARLLSELKKFLPFRIKTELCRTIQNNTGADSRGYREYPVSEDSEQGASARALIAGEFIPRWEDIKDMFFIDDIVSFALDLNQRAREYKDQDIENYSNELYEHTQIINIDEIERMIALFPDMLNNGQR